MSGEDPVNLEEIMETNPGTMALIQTGGLMKAMVEEIPKAQDMDHLIAAIGTEAMTGGTMIGTGTANVQNQLLVSSSGSSSTSGSSMSGSSSRTSNLGNTGTSMGSTTGTTGTTNR